MSNRSHACSVAEVVGEKSFSKLRACSGFNCDELYISAVYYLVVYKRKSAAGEVGAAAVAADDDIRIVVYFIELFLCLQGL